MRITTQKGWLAPLHPDHAEELFELIHESRSHLYPWLPWLKRIHSAEDTRAFIENLIGERGPQFVIVIDHKICGGLGFYILEERDQKGSIGYWLGQEFIGQGIMRDAIKALCQFGFKELQLQRIEIRCAADNIASRKVPESLGFCLDGVQNKAEWLTDRYVDHAIYSLISSELPIVCEPLLPSSHMRSHVK